MKPPRSSTVLLINTPADDLPLAYPIGLDYLTSVLRHHGAEIVCLDLALDGAAGRVDRLRETLSRQPFAYVGFNLRNLCDQSEKGIRYLPQLAALVDAVRAMTAADSPRPQLVVGGAGAAMAPELVRRELGVEWVIAGDGEAGFVELLAGGPATWAGRGVLQSRWELSTARYQRGAWGHIEAYLQRGADANLQTRRGCAEACSYCAYPVVEGGTVRLRDPALVAEEFRQLERLGFAKVYIVDAVFNHPLAHAKAVLRALRAAGTSVEWTGFFSPRHLDRELLGLVRETHGGRPLKLTIESGAERMLATLGKGFSRQQILAATELCRSEGMRFSFTVLFGGPGENEETVAQTCSLIAQTQPEYVSASIGVYVYPRTPLARRTRGQLWRDELELMGSTMVPVDRDAVRAQVMAQLSACGFPVHIH